MNSNLVTYENITNKSNPRTGKILKITPHHYAGIVTTKEGTDYLKNTNRDVSANYVIGNEGGIGLNVPENRRAWTSASYDNDVVAVTIEVSNSTLEPNWEISDKAMSTLIKLMADIAKRNGIGKLYYDGTKEANVTFHEMFVATNCPGPYIKKNIQHILNEANKINGYDVELTPKPTPNPRPGKATSYQRPAGTYTEINGGGRFTNTTSDFIYMRQYVPNVNGVDNGHLLPGEYVDYTDVYTGNGFVWVGNGTTWIPTGPASGGKRTGEAWGTFGPKGGSSALKPTKEYIRLDKSRTSWAVYPLGVSLVASNAIGQLNPSLFGGLEYEVLGRPMANAITIQTRDWGKVNIYVGSDVSQWYKIVKK